MRIECDTWERPGGRYGWSYHNPETAKDIYLPLGLNLLVAWWMWLRRGLGGGWAPGYRDDPRRVRNFLAVGYEAGWQDAKSDRKRGASTYEMWGACGLMVYANPKERELAPSVDYEAPSIIQKLASDCRAWLHRGRIVP